ncbi:MAG: Endodeoxyribonuclease RusA [Candidatus Bathyarchaeota archaeon BA2]|nr:MAG: Endodeoxyribonuclease RusA [Candidatus Bathyarchaeota archaeon BA2]
MPPKRMVLTTDVYPLLGKIETAGGPLIERWKAEVVQQLKSEIKEKVYQCSLKLDFYISKDLIWKVDIDNLAEPVLNAVKEAGAYYDDSLVCNVEITKIPVLGHLMEKLHIELWEWE